MSHKATSGIQRRIEQLQARAEKLRTIQSMLADDPELAVDLMNILVAPPDRSPDQPPPSFQTPLSYRSDMPHVESVIMFFRQIGNNWQTVRQICDGTGLGRNSVNALLYTSRHKELFESELEGPKRRLFRLKEVFEQEAQEDSEPSLVRPRPSVRPVVRPISRS